jgi:hypothetical protein
MSGGPEPIGDGPETAMTMQASGVPSGTLPGHTE